MEQGQKALIVSVIIVVITLLAYVVFRISPALQENRLSKTTHSPTPARQFGDFSKKLKLPQLKLLWGKRYVKAAVVLALLVVALFFALKPTYTADEVTKKMQTYLGNKVYSRSYSLSYPYSYLFDGRERVPDGIDVETRTCLQALRSKLATPHYIPYRKAWLITTVSPSDYTWLFDERTGTIASSDGRC